MEPPASIDADRVRDEKLKVLHCLRPFTADDVVNRTVRGQYRSGAIRSQPVPAYLEAEGIPPTSRTETFVAIKAELDNWRWSGVPFYLRRSEEHTSDLQSLMRISYA